MAIQYTFPNGGALMAGGTGAIGPGVVEGLARAGVPVLFTYRSESSRAKAEALLERLTSEGHQVRLRQMDMCSVEEIEAALDDSNVGRFAGYLQKLTKNTQFIIITHRRGTMNAADRLYGITMQEKGVSTLVSVDLVENQLTQ